MSETMRYDWFNKNLFDIVPLTAKRILDVGCDTGLLGKELKKQDPSRFVAGIEIDGEAGVLAENHLDEVHVLNVEQDDVSHLPGNFDAIILGDVLEHLYDPLVALVKLRKLLADDGEIYTSIPNIQHYSIFRRLLKGDFQYRETGLLDSTHVRFYCLANIDKLMLDAGYLPRLHSRIIKKDEGLAKQLGHTISRLGISDSALRNMETFQYQNIARKAVEPLAHTVTPFSFVVHSQFTGILKDNFYASPIIKSGHPHQVMIYRRPFKLADALSNGCSKAINKYIVLVREHIYLPRDWDLKLMDQIRQIEKTSGDNWIAGAAGSCLSENGGPVTYSSILQPGEKAYPYQDNPVTVDCLDDNLIVMPASSAQNIDTSLGEYLHGVDLSLKVKQAGGTAYVVNAPCLENGPYNDRLPPGYAESKKALSEKWQGHLPLVSTNGTIE